MSFAAIVVPGPKYPPSRPIGAPNSLGPIVSLLIGYSMARVVAHAQNAICFPNYIPKRKPRMYLFKAAIAFLIIILSIPFFLMACFCLILKTFFNESGLLFGITAQIMIRLVIPKDEQ